MIIEAVGSRISIAKANSAEMLGFLDKIIDFLSQTKLAAYGISKLLNVGRGAHALLDGEHLTITQHGDTPMKKSVIVFLVLAGLSGAARAGLKYECGRYVNGEYQGFITVTADNKQEAERKAYEKYKQLGLRVDYVNCK